MKHVRLQLTPGNETIHPLFTMMTDSDYVSLAQMVDWNIGDTEQPTLLFAVEGDPDRIESELDSTSHLTDYELIPIDPGRFYLRVCPKPTSLTRKLFQMYTERDLVIIHPVVYHGGSAWVSLLGEPADLQLAMESFSSGLDVTVEQVSNFLPRMDTVSSRLSPRQREALETAFELGYYEYPRRATHADIGNRLGCASNTVSVHLQKAECKILSAVVERKAIPIDV